MDDLTRTPDGAWVYPAHPALWWALWYAGIPFDFIRASTKGRHDRRWTKVNLITWRSIMVDEHEGTPKVIVEPASRIIEAAVEVVPAVEVKSTPDAPEHKGDLTWARLEKVEARRDAYKVEVETLKAEVQRLVGVYAELSERNVELVGNVSDLKEDNDRLKDANATYAASLSPTGNAQIGSGEVLAAKDVKIAEQAQLIKDLNAQLLKAKRPNPVMTTNPPPIGVYHILVPSAIIGGEHGRIVFEVLSGDELKRLNIEDALPASTALAPLVAAASFTEWREDDLIDRAVIHYANHMRADLREMAGRPIHD